MTAYLDIGVVHIQSWLTRPVKLRGRRGGSVMISDATEPETITDLLKPLGDRVERNGEAGVIDGVVPLILTDESASREVEDRVISHLRNELPTASFRVSEYDGPTYAEARLKPARYEQTWAPPVSDWPPGKPCEWCYAWPAEPGLVDEERNRMCGECGLRRDAAMHAESGERMPSQENKLLKRLGTELRVPNMMKELARLGSDTHVALIYADGNAIGKFIGELHQKRDLPGVKKLLKEITVIIDESTWQALVGAVEAIWPDKTTPPPVIPHLVGGDDVLVSVPANLAWDFVLTLQSEFKRAIETEAAKAHVTPPSLSAGIVFHHYMRPLHVMHELAAKLLRNAKAEYNGEEAAIAWQDATRDGVEPIDRTPFLLTKLDADMPDLNRLAGESNASRQRLAELLRSHKLGDKAVEEHLQRLGLTAVVEPFREDPIHLTDALGMVHRWRR